MFSSEVELDSCTPVLSFILLVSPSSRFCTTHNNIALGDGSVADSYSL